MTRCGTCNAELDEGCAACPNCGKKSTKRGGKRPGAGRKRIHEPHIPREALDSYEKGYHRSWSRAYYMQQYRRYRREALIPNPRVCPGCGRTVLASRAWVLRENGQAVCKSCDMRGIA